MEAAERGFALAESAARRWIKFGLVALGLSLALLPAPQGVQVHVALGGG